MVKKLIFTLIVIAAVVFISFRLNDPEKEKPVAPEPSFTAEILSSLNQKKASSIVVLAGNNPDDIRNADEVIAALGNGKIKVLAYEIYNKDANPERLSKVALANGTPDVFYVNGKLLSPNEIDAFLKTELSHREETSD